MARMTHLSDGEAVAKMGHPGLCCGRAMGGVFWLCGFWEAGMRVRKSGLELLVGLLLLVCLPGLGQQVSGGEQAQAGGQAGSQTAVGQQAPGKVEPLTDVQMKQMLAIKKDVDQKAGPAAARVAEVTRRIYDNMLADKPDEALRAKLSGEMREAVWALLEIKGQSIHDAVAVLTPVQRMQLRVEMAKPGAPGDLSELIGKMFMPPEVGRGGGVVRLGRVSGSLA